MEREELKLEDFLRVKNGNDVRGTVIETADEEITLTPEMVKCIAAAFADYLSDDPEMDRETLRIAVGHDSRVSAEMMEEACLEGLRGVQRSRCGLITTPAMFQSTILDEASFDGAIMLTASHLPYQRNGMKFFTVGGALSGKELDGILRRAYEIYAPASDFPLRGIYAAHMRDIICEEAGGKKGGKVLEGLKIAVDAGNGAAGFFATEILEPLGADVSGSVFLAPNGNFPNHVPNPEDKRAMDAAKRAVQASGSDLGVIFDCDGDRAAVVFSDGTEVNRNKLIALLAAIEAETHPHAVIVTDSVTSDGLTRFLEGTLGLRHFRYRRGYKNVIDKGFELTMNGEDCPLAIETSGHGAFEENHFSDDGAYIAAKIIGRLALLRKKGHRIEDMIAELQNPAEEEERRFQILDPDFKTYGAEVLARFRDYVAKDARFTIVEPNYEGVRVSCSDSAATGWILLRQSLHDPVLPMNLEAENAGGVAELWERVAPFFAADDKLVQK